MHFWIDKRSQYAYTGRHRMPTTISSSGVGRGRARVYGEVGRKPRGVRRPPSATASRRPRSSTRQNTQPPAAVHGRREDSTYVEVPMEPALPSIAALAAARSVTPDTLLRTAALGLPAPVMAPHLKFGMLVSFALAMLFLAGAKCYFDRQMSRERSAAMGSEAGVVCIAVACACGLGCALVRCRPRPPPAAPPDRVSSTARRERTRGRVHDDPTPPTRSTPSEPSGSDDVSLTTLLQGGRAEQSPEAPPPYHIAVLLPPRDPSPPHYSACYSSS